MKEIITDVYCLVKKKPESYLTQNGSMKAKTKQIKLILLQNISW